MIVNQALLYEKLAKSIGERTLTQHAEGITKKGLFDSALEKLEQAAVQAQTLPDSENFVALIRTEQERIQSLNNASRLELRA